MTPTGGAVAAALARAMISAYDPFFGTFTPSTAGDEGATTAGGFRGSAFDAGFAEAIGAVPERLSSFRVDLLGAVLSAADGLLVPRYGTVCNDGFFGKSGLVADGDAWGSFPDFGVVEFRASS